jgi:hypothetical protein
MDAAYIAGDLRIAPHAARRKKRTCAGHHEGVAVQVARDHQRGATAGKGIEHRLSRVGKEPEHLPGQGNREGGGVKVLVADVAAFVELPDADLGLQSFLDR